MGQVVRVRQEKSVECEECLVHNVPGYSVGDEEYCVECYEELVRKGVVGEFHD